MNYDNGAINVVNSTLVAKKVQFDAFRTKDRAPPGFRVILFIISNVYLILCVVWKNIFWVVMQFRSLLIDKLARVPTGFHS